MFYYFLKQYTANCYICMTNIYVNTLYMYTHTHISQCYNVQILNLIRFVYLKVSSICLRFNGLFQVETPTIFIHPYLYKPHPLVQVFIHLTLDGSDQSLSRNLILLANPDSNIWMRVGKQVIWQACVEFSRSLAAILGETWQNKGGVVSSAAERICFFPQTACSTLFSVLVT